MVSRFTRSVPVTINDVLDGHVALDLQCLDRLYLHGYLAQLQVDGQVIQFLSHRGYPVPSPACLQQIGDAFRRRVASFAEANHNIELMKPYLDRAAAAGRPQVAAIGVAQEMQRVLIARQRHTAKACQMTRHDGYTIRQAAYDLRKLRGKNLTLKPGRTRRYHVPPQAARTIAALLALRNHIIAPILAGVRSPRRGRKPAHWTTIDRDYETLRTGMQTLFNHLGIDTLPAAA